MARFRLVKASKVPFSKGDVYLIVDSESADFAVTKNIRWAELAVDKLNKGLTAFCGGCGRWIIASKLDTALHQCLVGEDEHNKELT